MVGGVSGLSAYYNPYQSVYGAAQKQPVQSAQSGSAVWTVRRAAQPESPVQPVTPARPVNSNEDPAQTAMLRYASDPAEAAVRMRIQYPGSAQQAQAPIMGQARAADGRQAGAPAPDEAKSAREVMEEGECQTCKERKYQDGSDDPGVSFKTPTSVAPEQAASAVRGHENEHVVREQTEARREDRRVVSQSVTYHTSICPECGRVYVSGGSTRTVTKANTEQESARQQAQQQSPRAPFSAVA